MPQYPHAVQLRAAGDRGRNPRIGAAIRQEAERLHPSVEGERGGFNDAVEEVADTARRLLQSLETNSPPRDREVEAAKARARSRQRFEFGGA